MRIPTGEIRTDLGEFRQDFGGWKAPGQINLFLDL